MSADPTEAYRRALIEDGTEIEVKASGADALGTTWTTAALAEEFEVQGFLAPFVIVRRRACGTKGTLMFRHSPRIYFDWKPQEELR